MMGNMSPTAQIRGAYPNFVISGGCDIPPQSSWENIDAFFAAAKGE